MNVVSMLGCLAPHAALVRSPDDVRRVVAHALRDGDVLGERLERLEVLPQDQRAGRVVPAPEVTDATVRAEHQDQFRR
jgi:hypothetical protein